MSRENVFDPSATRAKQGATTAPPAPSRALRLLAAADRVREAGEQLTRSAVAQLRRAHPGMGSPYVAQLERRRRALLDAQRDLTAIALEPGDCAWERAVLEAAGRYRTKSDALRGAYRAFDEVRVSRFAYFEEDAYRAAGDEARSAEFTLKSIARGDQ